MEKKTQNDLVLVTGASGYLASHIILQLLEKGYKVRGTVRDLSKTQKYSDLYNLNNNAKSNLEILQADLMNEEDWKEVFKGVDYVLHTASPCVIKEPKDPNVLIKPALSGVRNIFKYSILNKIKKIVMTSSTTTVAYGNKNNSRPENYLYTEKDWSDDNMTRAYNKSKLIAEKEAWNIYDKNSDKINLSVIVPGIFLGPILLKNKTASLDFFSLFWNSYPKMKCSFGFVDVRDVAEAHISAMEKPELTRAKRYILVENSYYLDEITQELENEFSTFGYRFNKKNMWKILFKVGGLFSNDLYVWKNRWGRKYLFDHSNSVKDLGIKYRSVKEMVTSCGYDYIKKGYIKNLLKQTK